MSGLWQAAYAVRWTAVLGLVLLAGCGSDRAQENLDRATVEADAAGAQYAITDYCASVTTGEDTVAQSEAADRAVATLIRLHRDDPDAVRDDLKDAANTLSEDCDADLAGQLDRELR